MDLLGFARGPALKVALAIFCLGVVWRIVGFALLRLRRDLNKPRTSTLKFLSGGVVTIGSRSWPHKEFIGRTGAGEALGYSYHIGLFVVVLLFGPHIVFLGSLFGFTWPGLPSSLITMLSVLTLTLFLAVLFRRVTNPVMRMLSNFDDYFSWFITALVLVTGLAATAHIGAPYEKLLAWHILSVDALLIWFPFGKLMHAFYIFPSRAINGALLARKGAIS
jgi:nitrate reductase gamma subunit